MIHLDSAERSTQRVNDYLHDPAAFSEKLNANRRKRLMSMLDSLSDSVKILKDRLGIVEHDESYTIDTIIAMVAERVGNDSGNVIPVQRTSDDSESSEASVKKKPLSNKQCRTVYSLYAQTLMSSICNEESDSMLSGFTTFMLDHFNMRFAAGKKYGIFQIHECITKMFVQYAHCYYNKNMDSFHRMYNIWMQLFEEGKDHYVAPAFVSCFNTDTLHDAEIDFIKESWSELIDTVYAPITRINIRDAAMKSAFLFSNPFREFASEEQKGAVAATS